MCRPFRSLLLLSSLYALFGCSLEVGGLTAPPLVPRPSQGAADAGVSVPSGVFLVGAGNLRVVLLDIEDPTSPIEVASLDPREGEDEEPLPVYSLTASEEGSRVFVGRYGMVEVYDVHRASLDRRAEIWLGGSHALSVASAGQWLYVAMGEEGVAILDLSNLDAVETVARIPALRSIHDLVLLDPGHLAIYDADDSALFVYDVSDPAAPKLASSWITDFVGSRSAGMAASGGFLALNAVYSGGGSGLWFWIFDDFGAPTSLGFHPDVRAPIGGGVALWPGADGAFGYFADREGGVVIAETRLNRGRARSGHLAGMALDVLVSEDVLYVAQGDVGIAVYSLSADRPESPIRVSLPERLGWGAERLVRVSPLDDDGDEARSP